MKIKVKEEGFKVDRENIYEIKLNERIDIARFGGFFRKRLQFAITPLKIFENGMEFKVSGDYSKYNAMKVNTQNKEKYDINECYSKNGVYSIYEGEELRFLGKSIDAKDAKTVYVLNVE